MKENIKKAAGAGLMSLALVFGVAGFAGASSGTIGTTGPDSENEIYHENKMELEVENDNDVDLWNKSEQKAASGDAKAFHNTTAGDAMSGDASNANAVAADVEVDNSQSASAFSGVVGGGGSDSGSINNTGPDSENKIKFENRVEVEIENDNDVDIHNYVEQHAYTGDAKVYDNTTGGDAVSGSASNTTSTTFSVKVTN